jgi:hypothetical protein
VIEFEFVIKGENCNNELCTVLDKSDSKKLRFEFLVNELNQS